MQKVKKVKDAPKNEGFTGSLLLSLEPFDFVPDKWLDSLGFAKENRPVFRLRPLNSKERHFMEADQSRMTSEGMLWAKKEGIDLSDQDNFYLVATKFSEYSEIEKRRDIVRGCIVGFTMEGSKFRKDEEGGLSKAVFEKFPTVLVNAIETELLKKSRLTNGEVLGL